MPNHTPAYGLFLVNVQSLHIEEPSTSPLAISQNANLENQMCPQARRVEFRRIPNRETLTRIY